MKISDRQPKISDSLKISDFWGAAAPPSTPTNTPMRSRILGSLKSRRRTSYNNNAGLISKVSAEIVSKNAENCRSRQAHCGLTPPPQLTPANIRINLILLPESRLTGIHFCLLIVWVYLHSAYGGRL